MMKKRRLGWLFGVGFVCGLSGVSSGAMTWEAREVKLSAEPGVAEVAGAFAFTNEAESPVTITSVKTSCGCTTAKLEQTTYEPGESGQINVTFAVGDRRGEQVKKVVVRTDDPAHPVATLTVRVDIPRLIELSPKLLRWGKDEKREAKVVDVRFHEKHPVVVTGAEVGEAEVDVELEEIEAGHHYRVKVRPEGGEALRAVVTLATERGEAEDEKNPLRFLVRAPAPGISITPDASASSQKVEDESLKVARGSTDTGSGTE